jgi:GNAT superfamily N-acetyltransferase
MSWRSKEEIVGLEAREALARLVEKGEVQGVIAYVDGEPAAWATFGPREHFYHAAHHPDFRKFSDCFAIPCFFVTPPFRGLGLTRKLLEKAVEGARRSGASIVEGYPVKSSESAETRQDWAFTGPPVIFEQLGFVPAGTCQFELQCVRLETDED